MPKKAVTLLGMSGSGKTYISSMLAQSGWSHYSCDYEIGTTFLKDDLSAFGGVTHDDIRALSVFLGKLGDEQQGGYPLDLFLQRQNAYYEAELSALRCVSDVLDDREADFVHDSTGSLCEILDDGLIADLGAKTLFVYLQHDEEGEREVLKRAQEYPKPLFFPPNLFEGWLREYLKEKSLSGVSDIVPDDFSRWVFPRLFESRKPKYQALADRYGVSIYSGKFAGVSNSDDIINLIAEAL